MCASNCIMQTYLDHLNIISPCQMFCVTGTRQLRRSWTAVMAWFGRLQVGVGQRSSRYSVLQTCGLTWKSCTVVLSVCVSSRLTGHRLLLAEGESLLGKNEKATQKNVGSASKTQKTQDTLAFVNNLAHLLQALRHNQWVQMAIHIGDMCRYTISTGAGYSTWTRWTIAAVCLHTFLNFYLHTWGRWDIWRMSPQPIFRCPKIHHFPSKSVARHKAVCKKPRSCIAQVWTIARRGWNFIAFWKWWNCRGTEKKSVQFMSVQNCVILRFLI